VRWVALASYVSITSTSTEKVLRAVARRDPKRIALIVLVLVLVLEWIAMAYERLWISRPSIEYEYEYRDAEYEYEPSPTFGVHPIASVVRHFSPQAV